jgi:hypothetical protein
MSCIRTMLRPACWVLVVFGGALFAGCSSAENDLFDNTRQALAGDLGALCGEPLALESDTVDVDDSQAARSECGGGYCLHRAEEVVGSVESEGMCTCQCAGAEGGGPYCSCTEGFACEHLLDDIGFEFSGLAGSYCVPE